MGVAQGRVPHQVVIVGASFAGLLTAAALARPGRSVTILERDPDPGIPAGADGPRTAPRARPGVPQGRQPHVYLYRGLLAAEDLLPGLRAALIERGALAIHGGDIAWRGEQGWQPLGRPSFPMVAAGRPLVEDVVRTRVLALPGVTLRWGVRVDGLEREPDGRWRVRATGSEVRADLVVDASGRGSRLPAWLRELGVPTFPVEEIDAKVGYATRVYADGPATPDIPGVIILASPGYPAGGVAVRVEDGQWLVTGAGLGRLRPGRDPVAFVEFLRSLPDPALVDLTRICQPLSDVVVYRQTGNRRPRYDRVRPWPDGLLALGDTFCTFNPLYGQGITVAACEALLLRAGAESLLSPGGCARMLREFASVVDLPWLIATGEDRKYLSGEGRPRLAERLTASWIQRVDRLSIQGDRRAATQLARVYHLMGSPTGLFHPALVLSVLRAATFGYRPSAERPASLEALRAAVAAQA